MTRFRHHTIRDRSRTNPVIETKNIALVSVNLLFLLLKCRAVVESTSLLILISLQKKLTYANSYNNIPNIIFSVY